MKDIDDLGNSDPRPHSFTVITADAGTTEHAPHHMHAMNAAAKEFTPDAGATEHALQQPHTLNAAAKEFTPFTNWLNKVASDAGLFGTLLSLGYTHGFE